MMKFYGTFEELKEQLSKVCASEGWRQLNQNQFQYKKDGYVLNWYPSTGSINFQGRDVAHFEAEVAKCLKEAEEPQETVSDGHIHHVADDVSEEADFDKSLIDVYPGSELVLGFVGAVGTDLDQVTRIVEERLLAFKYGSFSIKISKDIITPLRNVGEIDDNYKRIDTLMTEGNRLRELSRDNSVLALAVSGKINQIRNEENGEEFAPLKNKAFLVNSLKHPEEVQRLRKIYSNGFMLIGVHSDERRRTKYLTENKRISPENSQKLIERDSDESADYGQHTRDTFHLSDFFVNFDGDVDRLQHELWRVVDLIFGKPYVTPTFDEFAMFMAFSSSLRSGDLSRQVGAVITKNGNIISTGANDVPRYGGGLYWPEYDDTTKSIEDKEDGRDFKRGYDSNSLEKKEIIKDALRKAPEEIRDQVELILKESRIKDITEYGRVVHAEMEAILACARSNISTQGATIYCTTFPCHNCAKHIVAAGIERVVYVEPYPKSKALDFHSDSISLGHGSYGESNVVFEPFVGVGPRSFFNHFSTSLGSGYPIKRKGSDGQIVEWGKAGAMLRMQMLPVSYLEREEIAASLVKRYLEVINEK